MSETPRVDAVLMCMTYPPEDEHSERYKAVIAIAKKLEREVDYWKACYVAEVNANKGVGQRPTEVLPNGSETPPTTRNAVISKCREACLDVGENAHEVAKYVKGISDISDYVSGYQDAAVDCDEALRRMLDESSDIPSQG